LLQCAPEDRVRLVRAEQEKELVAEEERGLGSPERILDQLVCLSQVLEGAFAAHERLGRGELD
jgi:hypothetical protein